MTGKPLRIGDADRLAAADQLTTHTTDGRLTLAEHDQRVTAVWAAHTRADLDAIFTDLPALAAPPVGRTVPGAAASVVSLIVVVAVLTVWLAELVDPAWAATMMAACM